MARLAVMTIGLLHEPWDHPRVEGFVQRTGPTFAAAAGSEGYLGRSGYDDQPTGETTWGTPASPALFQNPDDQDRRADTLSLWQDLESVFAFAYHGTHAEALSHRKEWFAPSMGPFYVAWWVPDHHTPTWHEACERYDRLQRDGPSPHAFELKQPFDPAGQPTKIDRDVVRAKIARNLAQHPSGTQIPTAAPSSNEYAAPIQGYVAAWSEPDLAERQRLLAAVWAEHGQYTDRTAHVTGRAALDAHIGQFLKDNPGARFTLTGPIDQHHQHVRFFWTLRFANGVELPGMDYGELSPEGKLAKIVGFF